VEGVSLVRLSYLGTVTKYTYEKPTVIVDFRPVLTFKGHNFKKKFLFSNCGILPILQYCNCIILLHDAVVF
jgi:hypothetical protein